MIHPPTLHVEYGLIIQGDSTKGEVLYEGDGYTHWFPPQDGKTSLDRAQEWQRQYESPLRRTTLIARHVSDHWEVPNTHS